MHKYKLIFVLIVCLGSILRFYNLNKIPPSLYWDGASIGYNAYSITKTGRDEWGQTMPFFFEAFNEYKFPVAIYATSMSIPIFSFTDFAIRFPSAFLGSASILVFFLILRRTLKNIKFSIIGAYILSLSMWQIQFSRAMFEANIGLFFQLSTIYLLILQINKITPLKLLLFIACFFLSVYSYSVLIVSLPIILMMIIMFFQIKPSKKFKHILLIICVFSLTIIPFLLHVLKHSYTRFNQVSVFEENKILQTVIQKREKTGIFGNIIYNKYSAALISVGINLFSYFNPRFYISDKDGNARHASGMGLIFTFELLLLCGGLIIILFKKSRLFFGLLYLYVLSLLPACFTKNNPHALRSLCTLPLIIILIANGLFILQKKHFLIKTLLIFSYVFFSHRYLSHYYYVYPQASFSSWGGENKMMMEEAKKRIKSYQTVYFTGDYWRPYIYYYYYFKIEPQLVQKNNNSTKINNVYFGYAKWDKGDRRYNYNFDLESLFSQQNILLFLSPEEKKTFHYRLLSLGFESKQDVEYNHKHIFSIYEK